MSSRRNTSKTTTKSKSQSAERDALGIKPVHKINRPRRWVVYGRSKTGKTTFAGTFPKPALLVDIKDEGTDSVIDVEDLDVKQIETVDDLEDIYEYLARPGHGYKTVILDTVTQLQQMLSEEIVAGKNLRGKAAGDWGTMTKKDWGALSADLKDWVGSRFRNLPMEVVFIAQEKVTAVDDDGQDDNVLIPEVGPAIMPSVATLMNANVDIIVSTFIRVCERTKKDSKGGTKKVEDIVYCLRVGPNPIYTTGIRKGKSIEAPPYIENPTFEDVMEIIRGE